MIEHPAFTVEEWSVRETDLHLDTLAQTESIFALSNGHIGLRGNLDEGEPHGLPGTYLNSFYELRPLPYAEGGYAYPESGQTVINVTNGKLIRLLVDDEPFDVRYGEVQDHERELDLRDGVLRRSVRWTSPAGRTVKVSSVRMVSFTQRAIAAISYEVEPLDAPVRVVVQSELVANEALPDQGKDPRVGAALASPLESEEHLAHDAMGLLIHHTRVSGLLVGAAMDHHIEGPAGMVIESESHPDVVRVSVTTRLKPGERLRIVKFISYGWSSLRSRPAIHDQVMAALSAARLTGWEGLLAEQRAYLDDFWASADVELEGDPEIQQAVRFALFHVLQAGARVEAPANPGKGADRPRLRRPRLLGHGDLRPAGADTDPASRRRRRPALAPLDSRQGKGACARAGAARGRLPVAHHPGGRVFGVLACWYRRLPYQCGHRLCRGSLHRGDRRYSIRGGGGPRVARRDGAAVAFPRLSQHRHRPVPHRWRHRTR